MRKLDFLRREYKKALKKGPDTIYSIDVPDEFYKKGDEGVWAQPYEDRKGLLGICLEHDYHEETEDVRKKGCHIVAAFFVHKNKL